MIDNVTKERVRGRREPNLIRGAKNNDLGEVKRAVHQRRDTLNKVEADTGFSALHYAVARGNLRIVTFLLEQDDIDLRIADIHNREPLDLAVDVGHQGIVVALLKARSKER